MRRIFSDYMESIAANEDIVFVTGDLGYNALENLQAKMGDRFINAGVAEQNMIGMAAGMAYKGFKVFVYSIAPFATFRCLEQIRVDICIHNLPVFVVGNGGGYGYGIMGATHHAIEDIACMSSLQNMTCYVPAFAEDVSKCVDAILEKNAPAYLRLGLAKKYPAGLTINNSVNCICRNDNASATIIALGPVVNNVIEALSKIDEASAIDLFAVTELPLLNLPPEIALSLKHTKKLLIVEEHVKRGGLAEHITLLMMQQGVKVDKFAALNAAGYPTKEYGSQSFHQTQSGLNPENIRNVILNIVIN